MPLFQSRFWSMPLFFFGLSDLCSWFAKLVQLRFICLVNSSIQSLKVGTIVKTFICYLLKLDPPPESSQNCTDAAHSNSMYLFFQGGIVIAI